ncbi:MAG TPA: hypothetical protein DEP17_05305 [Lachnospiraceae bacterium]|nr:hypothetical protein [Lachnospiraceae bacterium]HCM13189.1 hypothetical protein [Lachnospiraceae bacterium]HCR39925.1 hypothetical protein [Lachnospiraceae bacterium]
MNLMVNHMDYSLVNAVSKEDGALCSGITGLTVRINKGNNNTLRLTGGHGEILIKGISVELFD